MTYKGIAAGAILGTFLGSLAVALYPKRQEIFEALRDQSETLSSRAQEYLSRLQEEETSPSQINSNVAYGIAGLFVGAGLALALAPKTGKQFRSQFLRAYRAAFGKAHELAETFGNNTHPIRNAIRAKARTAKRLVKTKLR